MARKMYREAIDAYREGDAKSAILRDKIGIAYHQLGDLNAARKSYEAAIKLDPKYADAINNVGTIFYAQKRYRSAISRYRKALDPFAGFGFDLEQSGHRLLCAREISRDVGGLREGSATGSAGL